MTKVTYEYNRQLQVTKMNDQRGVAHAHEYDRLDRPVAGGIPAGVDATAPAPGDWTTYPLVTPRMSYIEKEAARLSRW